MERDVYLHGTGSSWPLLEDLKGICSDSSGQGGQGRWSVNETKNKADGQVTMSDKGYRDIQGQEQLYEIL